MATQNYATHAGRINKLKGEILAHAQPVEVLGITGQQKGMPKNKGDTIVYRRWLPFGDKDNIWIDPDTSDAGAAFTAAHVSTEGVTPAADTLEPKDIVCTLQEYEVLYSFSNRVEELYEDDVPAEMKRQTGERIGLIREMIRWGELRAGGTADFAGGTTRDTVSEAISLPFLRRISRGLQSRHARRVTEILEPSTKIDTRTVEAAYLVFGHTDLESDFRDLPNFKTVAEYGTRKVVSEYEIGSVENYRIILSPELAPILAAGEAVGATGLTSIGGANVDVYPMIVCGEDAWGQLALRGMDSITPTHKKASETDKSDPLGKRGYVGARFYFDTSVMNDGWMSVAEVGASAL